ncbi:MAG TPA: hypothetical protein VGT78_13250 [Rhizomicrobium sp.]|nr:hypothetical protein [Rhizomicrobium sp.]
MQTYELRLLNRDGGMTLFYIAQCASDDDAKDHLQRIKDKRYHRYELWQGQRKICEGLRPNSADAAA